LPQQFSILSGSSVAKQFGIILGGGIAPLAGTTLVGATGSFSSVIVYFDIIAVVAFIGLFYAPESSKTNWLNRKGKPSLRDDLGMGLLSFAQSQISSSGGSALRVRAIRSANELRRAFSSAALYASDCRGLPGQP